MKRIYIAGPMSGLPDFNYPVFNAKAAELRALGFHVENPAENRAPHCRSWLGYMRLTVAQLVTCDVVYLLPGWRYSRGACIEHQLALSLGLRVVDAHALDRAQEGAIMDEADRADEVYELSLRHAVFMARNSGPLAGSSATGACLLCDEVISEPGRRWCGAVCRDGWELMMARRHA